MKLVFLERMMGVDLRCGGGRLGWQHATGMLPRALAFDSHRSKEEGPPSRAIPLLLERMMGVDLRSGGGRVAALERPRRSIHSRSRSNR